MRVWRGFVPLAVLLVAGCATVRGTDSREPIAPALTALRDGEYAAASETLASVWELCPGGELGERALLLGTAAALDPRNPERDASLSAKLAAAKLRARDGSNWTVPVTEVLYLLALELGGRPPGTQAGAGNEGHGEGEDEADANGDDEDGDAREPTPATGSPAARAFSRAGADSCRQPAGHALEPRPLPELPALPIADRAAALERERSELIRRIRALEQTVASQQEELERIRRTLNP